LVIHILCVINPTVAMSDTETRKETKEERKERKRLKKLKKEAKKAKKRKLEELQNGTTEEVETPAAKKMKLSDDEKEPTATEEVNFDEISKAVIYATKEQLQNTLIKCAKSSPSHIPEMEKILGGSEIDESLRTLLAAAEESVKKEKEAAAFGFVEATGPRLTGVVLKWNHDRGFGFVKRDDNQEEIFCHTKSIVADRKNGHKNAKSGSKVEFHIQTGEKGASAVNVTAVGGGPCEGGTQFQGTVRSWLDEKMYGFIQGDDGNDYFAGDRDVWLEAGVLTPGERVQFDVKYKEDGRCQATFINSIGGEYWQ